SKAEFYEMYSEYLRNEGYFVRSYNLLDLQASDGWNCLMDSADDVNLVQHIAEVIIRNTSADSEREDFWSKAEKNLLMALIHYVQSLTYPNPDKLLPPEERSLGTIYRLLCFNLCC
ncbi:MAG: type IV secretory system conjugative DNA transfer family protein, partial [[Clostridium] leptum]